MESPSNRIFKDSLYGLFARIGKALSNPHRLEMLELLAQGERTVESLASEMGLSVANASQHLQALRQAALVDSRKDGLFVHYSLAAPGVFELSKAIRTVAEDRLADLDRLVREHFADRDDAEAVQIGELLKRARSKEIVILEPPCQATAERQGIRRPTIAAAPSACSAAVRSARAPSSMHGLTTSIPTSNSQTRRVFA